MKKHGWYKAWHSKDYAEAVHYIVFFSVAFYDLYLVYNFKKIVDLL
jgi:hypothetical protein